MAAIVDLDVNTADMLRAALGGDSVVLPSMDTLLRAVQPPMPVSTEARSCPFIASSKSAEMS